MKKRGGAGTVTDERGLKDTANTSNIGIFFGTWFYQKTKQKKLINIHVWDIGKMDHGLNISY